MTKIIKSFLLFFCTFLLFVVDIFAQNDQKAELVVQLGHSNIVGATAFSPDGRYLVTGDGFAKVLILWETESGRELRRFLGHENTILKVAFSRDGNFIASISTDKTIRKWDILTGREMFKIDVRDDKNNSEPLKVLAFANDDKFLIAGTKSSLEEPKTEQTRSNFRPASDSNANGESEPLFGSKFAPSMQIWSATTGKLLQNESYNEPLAVSSDGKFSLVRQISAVSLDDINTDEFLVWNLAENRLLVQLNNENGELTRKIDGSVNFSSDGAAISAIVSERVARRKVPNEKIKFSKYGAGDVGIVSYKVAVWDAATGSLLKKIDGVSSTEKSILVRKNNSAQNGYILFSGCLSEQTTIKDGDGLRRICTVDLENETKSQIELKRFLSYNNSILSISATDDGRFVAVGTGDSTTTIIRVADNKIVSWLTGKMPYISDIAVASDGRSISTIAENNAKVRWDLITGKPVVEEKGADAGKGIIERNVDVVSHDGFWRVVRTDYNSVTLRRAATGETIFEF